MASTRFPLLLLLSALASVACGAPSPAHITSPPPPRVDTMATPLTFDLRFKGVGVLTANSAQLRSNLRVPNQFVGPNVSGTPLQIGNGACVPNVFEDCSWFFIEFALPAGTTGLNTIYSSDALNNLAATFDTTTATDTVITSLDIEATDSAFATSAYAASAEGGYRFVHRVVAPTAFQAAAAQEGAQSRVITAVSFESGQVYYLAYSWQNAASTTYETQVATATSLLAVGPAAQTLGANGYTITAFGGDSTDGYVLVGTRPHGATAPVPVIVGADLSTPGNAAVVAYFLRFAADTGLVATLVEQ